jgi:hypothetical protein
MRSTHSPILKTAHLAQNINSDSPTRAAPPPNKKRKKEKKEQVTQLGT